MRARGLRFTLKNLNTVKLTGASHQGSPPRTLRLRRNKTSIARIKSMAFATQCDKNENGLLLKMLKSHEMFH